MSRLADNPPPAKFGLFSDSLRKKRAARESYQARRAWFEQAVTTPPTPRWWSQFERDNRGNRLMWLQIPDSQKYRMGVRDASKYRIEQD